MEGLIFLFVLGILAVIFGLPIIALVRAGRARRLAKQSEKTTQELTGRIYTLEQQVLKLTRQVARIEELEWQGAPSKPPAEAKVAEPATAPLQVKPDQPYIVAPAPPAVVSNAREEIPVVPEGLIPKPLAPPVQSPPPSQLPPHIHLPSAVVIPPAAPPSRSRPARWSG